MRLTKATAHLYTDKLYKEHLELKKIQQKNKQLKEKNEQYKNTFKILSPIAYCAYWNYQTKECSHTCRCCDNLTKTNPKTDGGILVNGNRYCRLYKDGRGEEDTVFVNDLDELTSLIKEENE